jgi:hypothetical protein
LALWVRVWPSTFSNSATRFSTFCVSHLLAPAVERKMSRLTREDEIGKRRGLSVDRAEEDQKSQATLAHGRQQSKTRARV